MVDGTLKLVLISGVGSATSVLGGFRNYVGSSWKAVSLSGRNQNKLKQCAVYQASTLFLNEQSNNIRYGDIEVLKASIRTLHVQGSADEFLNTVTGRDDKLFKKTVLRRCVQLVDARVRNKNIYVWRGKSTEFQEGNEKWYYFPKLQETDYISQRID
ncbi:hypothetical protein MHC_02030 [Mycoplasma haemocanis str. Illinois]|uniref:Uncharacterized protein n=1 Tax=Mycoplasma haemocanis (strain Illinois) TaxID=1111676 RepID=H6N6K0_MYCHN|nr:hypothetical protein [Mycoplasma haemocanis]AEW45272.1 hypothetical protein MHC_02030 [Mycoplasma haemocanis str. Illinois]